MSRNLRRGVASGTTGGLLKVLNRRRDVVPETRSWYRIGNTTNIRNAEGETKTDTEVWIYDEIGYWGVTASDFARELSDIDSDSITVRLNSPGGEVYDGIAIMNALMDHKAEVTIKVDALAASIASVIAMAGDKVIMGAHAEFMIHDASTIAIGNASELQEVVDMLKRVSQNIAEVYAERAGGKVEDWRALMLAETWFSADEAVKAGLADEVAPKPKTREGGDDSEDVEDRIVRNVVSKWDLSNYRYAGRAAAPAPAAIAGGGAPLPDDELEPEEEETEVTEPEVEEDTPEEDEEEDFDFTDAFTTAMRDVVEPDSDRLSVFREAVRMVTDAPVPTPEPQLPRPTAPATVFPVDREETPVDPEVAGIDPAVFRAAVELSANNAPAPTMTKPELPVVDDEDFDFVIDPDVFYNSLKEAIFE